VNTLFGAILVFMALRCCVHSAFAQINLPVLVVVDVSNPTNVVVRATGAAAATNDTSAISVYDGVDLLGFFTGTATASDSATGGFFINGSSTLAAVGVASAFDSTFLDDQSGSWVDLNLFLNNSADTEVANFGPTNGPAFKGSLGVDLSSVANLLPVGGAMGAVMVGDSSVPGVVIGAYEVVSPPNVAVSPSSLSVNVGDPISLQADAIGGGPFSYQWFKDSTPIPGATNVAYSISPASTNLSGGYTVAVTNSVGFAVSSTAPVTVNQLTQSINFPGPGTVTFGTNPVVLIASASSGLSVSYQVLSGPASVTNSQLSLSGAGTIVVVALQPGDASYAAAAPVTNSFTVNPASQTITFPSIPAEAFPGGPVTLGATSSSGLPVGYSVADGPASVAGSTLTLTGAGVVTVVASQPGNGAYSAAASVTNQFTVYGSLQPQFVLFPAIADTAYSTSPLSLTATASSGLPVSFTLLSGAATLSGASLTLTGVGQVVVVASQSGGGAYEPATPVTNRFGVSLAPQSISFPALGSVSYGTNGISLGATSSSGLPVAFSLLSGPATLTSNVLSLTGVGTVQVIASQSGNSNFQAAPWITNSLTVLPLSQSVTFTPLPDQPYSTNAISLSATASSGLPVSFRVVSGPATVVANTLSLTAAGSIAVAADQAGGGVYAPASATNTFTVAAAPQSLTFAPLGIADYSTNPIVLKAVASSGLPVAFNVVSGPATVQGNRLFLTGEGLVVVNAAQTGQNKFQPVSARQTLLVVQPGAAESLILLTVDVSNPSAVVFQATSAPATTNDPSGVTLYAGVNLLGFFTAAATHADPLTGQYPVVGGSTLTASGVTNAYDGGYLDDQSGTWVDLNLFLNDPTNALSASFRPTNGPAFSGRMTIDLSADATVLPSGGATGIIFSGDSASIGAAIGYYQVLGSPNVLISPASATVSAGQSFALVAEPDGGGPYSFQWSLAGRPITGATNAGYSVGAAGTNDAGGYTVVVSNPVGTANGGPATVFVNQLPQAISFTNPGDVAYATNSIALTGSSDSGLPVVFTVLSGPATVAGNNLITTGVGAVAVRASQPGNPTYAAAVPVTNTFNVVKAAQTISFAPLTGAAYPGPSIPLSASASSGLTVSFQVISGPASLVGTSLTLSGPGTVLVAATQNGDADYLAAPAVTNALQVFSGLQSQSIVFNAISNRVYGTNPVPLSASASSGLPVSFSVVVGPAVANGATLQLTGVGTIVVEAVQEGGGPYLAATPVTNSFEVGQAPQTITFALTNAAPYSTNAIPLTAAASSGLQVGFSVVSGPGQVTPAGLVPTGAGSVVVVAGQAGNSLYLPAPSVTNVITIAPIGQSITFPALSDTAFSTAPIALAATADSGLPVAFSVVSGPATVSGAALHLSGVGQVVVAATQAGDSIHAPAGATNAFNVTKASQTVVFSPLGIVGLSTNPVVLKAVASSGLPVAFAVTGGPGMVAGNLLTPTGEGTITVTASQAGDARYQAASAQRSLLVVAPGADQTLVLLSVDVTTPTAIKVKATGAAAITNDASGVTLFDGVDLLGFFTATASHADPITGDYPVLASSLTANGASNAFDGVYLDDQSGTWVDLNVFLNSPTNSSVATFGATNGPAFTGALTVNLSGDVSVLPTGGASGPVLSGDSSQAGVVIGYYQVVAPPAPLALPATQNVSAGQSISLAAAADGGGPYSYQWNFQGSALPAATNSLLTITPAMTNDSGGYTVTVANPAGTNTSPPAQVVVLQLPQSITFNTISNQSFSSDAIQLLASSSSGLPVGFVVTGGPATVSGSQLTLAGAGLVTVVATQGGDPSYAPATPVTNSFTVTPAPQTISFAPLTDVLQSSPPVALNAFASSGLPVTFAVVSGPGSLVSGKVVVSSPGTVAVAAFQTGNGAYAAASPVTNSFNVFASAQPQSISFSAISNSVFSTNLIALSASASSGLPVSFAVVGGPASVSGAALQMTGSGTVAVAAMQPGGGAYSAAVPVTNTFVVSPAPQTIQFDRPNDISFTTNLVPIVAVASSGLPVSLNVAGGPASIVGGGVRLTGLGQVTLVASQTGGSGYAAAASVTNTFSVTGIPQTISFTLISDRVFSTNAIPLSATASSGLPVSFSVLSGPATVQGTNLLLSGAGAVKVAAIQAGGGLYAGAASTNQFNVSAAPQSITFTPPGLADFGTNPIVLKASASSGLPIVFGVVSGGATLSGNLLTPTGTGQVLVSATQPGNSGYASASVQRPILVTPPGTAQSLILLTVDVTRSNAVSFQATPASPTTNDVSGVTLYNGVDLLGFFAGVASHADPSSGGYPVIGSPTLTAAGTTNAFDATFLDDQSGGWVDLNLFLNDPATAVSATFTAGGDPAFAGGLVADLSADAAVLPTPGSTGVILSGDSAAPGAPIGYFEVVGPPSAEISPASLAINALQPLSLSAGVDGGGPYTYQWSLNGAPISGATNAAYSVGSSATNDAGAYTVLVTNPAGSATSSPAQVSVARLAQTIAFATPTNVVFSTNAVSLSATSSSGLPVNFLVVGGPGVVTGNSLTVSAAGAVLVAAFQPGDATYGPATPVTNAIAVAAAPQTIAFAPIADTVVTNSPVPLTASASSGLPVSFTVLSGPAVAGGGGLALTGAGLVVVVATQPGDANYTAAPPVTNQFNVFLAASPQTITFAPLPATSFSTNSIALSATASSGLPVSYSVIGGPAHLSGGGLILTGTGTVTVVAAQAGNGAYLAAIPVTNAFLVSQAAQTISFAPIPETPYSTNGVLLSASSSSGLPVSLAVATGPAVITGNRLMLSSPGFVTVIASQTGNSNYLAAVPVTNGFAVDKVTQSVAFTAIPNQPFTTNAIPLAASASSGSPVTFTILSGPATVAGANLTLTGVGAVQVVAAQAGDSIYAPASATNAFTVTAAPQTIAFSTLGIVEYTTNQIALHAVASSGLAVTFSVLSGPASVTNGILRLGGQGELVVAASQAGSSLYLPATTTQNILVAASGAVSAGLILSVDTTDPARVVIKSTGAAATTNDTSGVTLYAGVDLLGFFTRTATNADPATGGYPLVGPGGLRAAGVTNAFDSTYLDDQSGAWIDLNLFFNDPSTVSVAGFGLTNGPAFGGEMTVDLSAESEALPGAGAAGVVLSGDSASPGVPIGYYQVVGPPSASISPNPLTAFGGQAFELFATAIGGGPYAYQWSFNGSIVPGATNSNFQVAFATTNNAGAYTVTVVNPAASATSEPAQVSVVRTPQTISFASLPTISFQNSPVALHATASSGLPVSFAAAGPASVSGASLSLTGAGIISVVAMQQGDAAFLPAATVTNQFRVLPVVVGRFAFYNNSAWDGHNPAADAADDGAIAIDKLPLLPGQKASFTNYTSYAKGLNGIMVDLMANPGRSTVNVADLDFITGNDNNPAGWTSAPAPASVTFRPGAGVGGADRVVIIWPDSSVTGKWLGVKVLPTTDTGLGAADVFFFGNAVGDSGNSILNAQVNVLDEALIRAHPNGLLNPASITSPYDINRDKAVNVLDEALIRTHPTSILTALKLINLIGYAGSFHTTTVSPAIVETPERVTLHVVQASLDTLIVETGLATEPLRLLQAISPSGPWRAAGVEGETIADGTVVRWQLNLRPEPAFFRVEKGDCSCKEAAN
jgi:large repetitive protein